MAPEPPAGNLLILQDFSTFFEDARQTGEYSKTGANKNSSDGPAEGENGNDEYQEVSEENPGQVQEDDGQWSVVEVGPELVPLGANSILSIFDFFNGCIDLVVDLGLRSPDALPALNDASQAEVAVLVVEEEGFVQESDLFEHFGGVEGCAGAGAEYGLWLLGLAAGKGFGWGSLVSLYWDCISSCK